MPQRRLRSRSIKRRFIVTPGGQSKIHYRRPNPGFARCASCGNIISSIPRRSRSKMHKIPKSSHRPNRPYGGYYCTRCMRKKVKDALYASSS
ncbi:MAG: 50S ribosomal protein L34e [Candidatus Helarchaeota archaeon]